MKKLILTTALTFSGCSVAFLPEAWGQQPSFNCATNRAPDESTICSSAKLSRLDVEMSSLYFTLRDELGASQRSLLREAQRYWLGRRAACGASVNCIAGLYAARIPQLNAIVTGTPAPPMPPSQTPPPPVHPGGTSDACIVFKSLC